MFSRNLLMLFLIKCLTALIRAKVYHREKYSASLVSVIVVAIRDLYLILLSIPLLQVTLFTSIRSNTVRNKKPLPPWIHVTPIDQDDRSPALT